MHIYTLNQQRCIGDENEFPFPLKRGERRNSPKRTHCFDIHSPVPVNRFDAGDMRPLFHWCVCVLVAKGCGEKLFPLSRDLLGSWGAALVLAAAVANCLPSAMLLFIWTSGPSPSFTRQVEQSEYEQQHFYFRFA